MYVAVWIGLSGCVIMYNKYLLAYRGFPYPITLTMWCVPSSLAGGPGDRAGWPGVPVEEQVWVWGYWLLHLPGLLLPCAASFHSPTHPTHNRPTPPTTAPPHPQPPHPTPPTTAPPHPQPPHPPHPTHNRPTHHRPTHHRPAPPRRHMFFCAALAIGLVKSGKVQAISMDRETYIK